MAAPISIVTIVKDYPDGFRRTADSIAMQTVRENIEWIVVDGSTQSKRVAEMIEQKNDIVSWSQSQPDGGIYNAMNIGLEQATGDFVQFLNAGDTLLKPDSLQKICSVAAASPDADFIYGDFDYLGQTCRARPLETDPARRGRMATSHQAMFFARNTIGSQRYPEKYKIASDYAFYFDYMHKVKKPIHVGEPIIHFEGKGVSAKCYVQAAMECLEIRTKENISTAKGLKWFVLAIGGGMLRKNCEPVYEVLHKLYRASLPDATKEPGLQQICPPLGHSGEEKVTLS